MTVNAVPLVESYTQRLDSGHDIYDPEFNWQKDYLVGGAAVAREYRPTRDSWGPLVVPPGNYFVLGDNRDNSADSRAGQRLEGALGRIARAKRGASPTSVPSHFIDDL